MSTVLTIGRAASFWESFTCEHGQDSVDVPLLPGRWEKWWHAAAHTLILIATYRGHFRKRDGPACC
jgi:hypothetical protein